MLRFELKWFIICSYSLFVNSLGFLGKSSSLCATAGHQPRAQRHNWLTLTSSSADIGDETSSARLRLGRTHLAGVAPCPSNGGTAQSLCADDACQLSLAHLVIDLSEAWASPIIWNIKEEEKKGLIITPNLPLMPSHAWNKVIYFLGPKSQKYKKLEFHFEASSFLNHDKCVTRHQCILH